MIITNSTMQLDHFNDFYLLEALSVDIMRQISENPRLEFSHSVNKLQEDILDYRCHVIPNLALRTFVYLYAACMGEARHAAEQLAKSYYLYEFRGGDRSDVFDNITEYEPSPENLKKLVKVYEQPWRGAFGGEAWGNIARALMMYFEQTPESFIDHVIDLEHNNGTVFSKNESMLLKMKLKYISGNFTEFLNYKFGKDMLRDQPEHSLAVSRKSHSLLRRYTVIFRNDKPLRWFLPMLDNLGDYEVKWGHKQLDLKRKWGNWVDVRKETNPNAGSILTKFRMYDVYVNNHTPEELARHLVRIRTKAKYFLARNRVRLSLKQELNKFYERQKHNCKLPKEKVTYAAIPVWYKASKGKIEIQLPVKSEILEPTPYGSLYVGKSDYLSTTSGNSKGLNGQRGYVRAMIVSGGSCPKLIERNDTWYLPSAKKLEAIIR